ncbi:MAG: DNA polymerase III subunit chi [Parachlamydiaceae bacterium]|nr:DNA polymerase III subunit chi [Parachlamydiaceae bacterium]
MKPTIYFLNIPDNASKLTRLCATVQKHFEQGQKVLIQVANDEAAIYIDQLLWRLPEEGFLPHQIAKKATNETIAISTTANNWNNANILINLCPDMSQMCERFEMVYELNDTTHPEKLRLSLKRQNDYKASGYTVEEI